MSSISMPSSGGTLDLNVASHGTTRVIEVGGELDLASVDALGSALEECEGDGTETVLIDLGALEFIDSSGIALLILAHQRLNGNGRSGLRVIPSRAEGVRRVLAMCGVEATLPFVEEGPHLE